MKFTTSHHRFIAHLAVMAGLVASPATADSLSGLPRAEPVVCVGDDDLVVRGQSIATNGIAVEVDGNCDVEIIDSHIVSADVAVRVAGNGTVRISGSYLEGAAGAVRASGNGDVYYGSSTLRGGVRQTGNSDTHDQGGNTVEVLPNAATPIEAPFVCTAGQRVSVVHQVIQSDDTAITVQAGCELLLSGATVQATTALDVQPGGVVRLRNTRLDGAIHLAAGARVHAAGSSLASAPTTVPTAEWIDGGGNDVTGTSWAGQRSASSRRSSTQAADAPRARAGSIDTSDAAAGLAEAARVLGSMARGATEIAEDALPAPERDPANPLVGAWRVTQARLNGATTNAGGSVAFYRAGHGLQSLWVETSAGRLPLLGAFRWRSSEETIHVDADGEITRWHRLDNETNRQRVRLDLPDGSSVELVLDRR